MIITFRCSLIERKQNIFLFTLLFRVLPETDCIRTNQNSNDSGHLDVKEQAKKAT